MLYNLKGRILMGGSVALDKTLTVEGAAADAKATGDAIKKAKDIAEEAKDIAEEAKRIAEEAVDSSESGGSFNGIATSDLDMDGYRIKNMGAPQAPGDAVTKEYADKIEEKINRFTNTEVGADGVELVHLSGSGTTIVDVATPVNDTDAANKKYVDDANNAVMSVATEARNTANTALDTANAAVKRAGDTMSGVLNMGEYNIKNVATPTENGDAVNKTYADKLGTLVEVLFSNSTTSSFGAQSKTVSNLAEFDEFRVECWGDSGVTEIGSLKVTETVLNDSNEVRTVVYATVGYNGSVVQVIRGFIFGSNKIQIGDCYMAGGTGTSLTTWNTMLIPTKIIGIKYGGGKLPRAEEMLFG